MARRAGSAGSAGRRGPTGPFAIAPGDYSGRPGGLIPAQSLEEVLRDRGPLPPLRVASIGLQILSAPGGAVTEPPYGEGPNTTYDAGSGSRRDEDLVEVLELM